MTQLTKLQKLALNLIGRGQKLGDKMTEIITKLSAVEDLVGVGSAVGAVDNIAAMGNITTSTVTGADPTVTITGVANATQIVADNATPPTGAVTLVLPTGAAGREFTIVNNSTLSVTVKGKVADTGIEVATTKSAKVVILDDNTAKRITADV